VIEDGRRLAPGQIVSADVCVIGSGAAGITTALELAATGRRIVVLAGGGRRERHQDRDLYRGSASPPGSHEPLEDGRRRMWGGTTSAWGGRCVPLDPIDFDDRPWIPHSGWPLSYEEMLPHFARANTLCEAGAFRYSAPAVFPQRPAEIIAGFDGAEMVTDRLERWSPPTNFARRYGRDLRAAENVRVLLSTHAVHLQLAPRGERVDHIVAASRPSLRFRVTAAAYVLAAGGLENTRLLLASDDVAQGGVGNGRDKLGRCYMAHLYGVAGWLELDAPQSEVIFGFERDEDGVYCRRRFWLTPAAQSEHRIGNGIGFFYRPEMGDPAHGNPLFSATHLAKSYLGALRRGGGPAAASAHVRSQHWRVVVKGLPRLVPEIAGLVSRRFLSRRRLPVILGRPVTAKLPIFFQTEHVPHPDSRVVLADERDALGMRRLKVRVTFGELDIETAVQFHRILASRVVAAGLGRFHYDGEIRERLAQFVAHFNSGSHHIGATRMAASADDGVVDPDCRVHGLENLYVAGSSVFPTSGHANPTLTVVALAVRLAEHLKSVMSGGS
jgi:choline dehydrogenase-like flavoprotein